MALQLHFPGQLPTPRRPDFLEDQAKLAKLPYIGPQAEQDLIGKELENAFNRVKNKYAEEDITSTIANRKAQTGYTGALTKSEQIRHPLLAEQIRAETAKNQLQAQKMQMLMEMMQQAMGQGGGVQMQQPGAQPHMAGVPQTQAAPFDATGMSQNTQPQIPGGVPGLPGVAGRGAMQPDLGQIVGNAMQPQQPMTPAPMQPQGMNPELAHAILASELNIPSHPGQVIDGYYTYQDPWTREIKKVKVAPSDAEKITTQEEAKYAAAADEGARNAIEAAYAQTPITSELLEKLNDPNFYKAVGTGSDIIRKLGGSKEANDMAGSLTNLLGEKVNKASRQFGNKLTNREFMGLQRTKGSTSDNPYELAAKIRMMDAMNKFELAVNQKYLQFRGQGYNRDAALAMAYETVDYSDIKKLSRMDDMAYSLAQKKGTDYANVMRQAEKASRDFNMPIDQVLKEMSNG